MKQFVSLMLINYYLNFWYEIYVQIACLILHIQGILMAEIRQHAGDCSDG
jgi:hypothetical protein